MNARAACPPDQRHARQGPMVRYMLVLLGISIVTGIASGVASTYYDLVESRDLFRSTWGGVVGMAALLLAGVGWTWRREKDCPTMLAIVACVVAIVSSFYGWYGPYLLLNGWLSAGPPKDVTAKIERVEEREYRSKNRTGIAYYAVFPHWENPAQTISLRVKREQVAQITSGSQVQARVGRGAFGWEYWVAGSVSIAGIAVK